MKRPTVLVAIMLIGLLAAAMLACETRTAAPSGTELPALGATATDAPSGVEATQAPPKAAEAPAQSPTLTSTATPSVVPAATPAPAPTAAPTASPTAVPVPTPTPAPTAVPTPSPTAVPVPTSTPTPVPAPSPTTAPAPSPIAATPTASPGDRELGFPWEQDGLTAIEREALNYLQHIEREHPPAFENVIGYQWLADGINEGERRFLCNVSQVAETSAALAIVQSVSPTLSPPVDYLAGCPTNTPPPTPAPAPTTTPTPMPQPTSTPTPTPQPTSTPVLQPALDISPLRGSPGDVVSVTGTNFPGLATVSRIEIGGVSVIPATPYSTTADGAFTASVVVPRLDVGTYHCVVTVGDRSSTATFSVVESATTAGEPVAAALAPLGDNLLWAAYYDNATKQWSVYDPSGTFSPDLLLLPPGQSVPSRSSIGALTHLVPGKVYGLYLTRDETVTLRGTARTLTAGINSVSW